MRRQTARDRIQKAIGPDKRWVIPQLMLITVVAIGTPVTARRGKRLPALVRPLALPLLLASAWSVWRAKEDLSDSFTMSPTPVADGEMIEHGVYGAIRHPMYLSVLLGIAGYAAAWRSGFGVLSLLAGAVFISAKIRHEEGQLADQYPTYEAYCQRVRWRCIPGVY